MNKKIESEVRDFLALKMAKIKFENLTDKELNDVVALLTDCSEFVLLKYIMRTGVTVDGKEARNEQEKNIL